MLVLVVWPTLQHGMSANIMRSESECVFNCSRRTCVQFACVGLTYITCSLILPGGVVAVCSCGSVRERVWAVREPPNNQIKSCLAVQRCPDQQSDRNLGYRSRIYVGVFSDVCFRASCCCGGQWSLPSMQLRASRNEWIANII